MKASGHLEHSVQVENVDPEKHDGTYITTPVVLSNYASMSSGACIKKFWRLFCTGTLTSVGAMYYGYTLSAVGSIIANQGFIEYFATVADPTTGLPALDAQHVSLWGAAVFISQLVIQIIAPFTADRWGRKFNMWLLTFFLTLSIVLSIVATNWVILLLAKFAGGFAGGLLSTSIMIYMSEIAMPQFRGALLSSFSLFLALGQTFTAVGLKILDVTAPLRFRNIFYSEFVFLGLWLIPMLYLPESPVWLATKGRHDKAKKSLHRLIGNVHGYDIDHEYAVIKYEVESSQELSMKHSSKNEWRSLLTKVNMRRTIIATLPITFQNFVGVPLIFGYTTYFFSLAGVADPFLGSIIIQLVLLLGIVLGLYLVDLAGRRQLVLCGGGSMGVLTAIIGGLGFMEISSPSGTALVALCAIWAFIYAVTLAPIGWVSLVELSTPMLRAKATSIAAIIQTLTGILFTYTVPLMLSDQQAGWGQKTGLFFSGITYLFLIVCIFLFPETKGRTYQELDELFASGIPAWKFAKTKTTHQDSLNLHQGQGA
ncbi:general substrate transporter [Leptodontidium sp. MPI-SDFR-AT-0119]|nr:general substrate transporter [Leptodontidium sp. MPI-SDFR-AT-0119]